MIVPMIEIVLGVIVIVIVGVGYAVEVLVRMTVCAVGVGGVLGRVLGLREDLARFVALRFEAVEPP